ncbi:P-loop containing nucleoside triphosphate hydrolase protein [Panaeolus papilionaceus]|nr:P-loop containing nucleoside triphosphate hydrolase protein [Panaeolus papilionaceus]
MADAFIAKESDIVILIMGATGTGKSSFISHFFDTSWTISSNQTTSKTKEVTAYRMKNHALYGDRVVLIDTPGFDHTDLPDVDVLKTTSRLLSDWYGKRKTLLAGILYLHRITDNRVTGTAIHNLQMFRQLCGEEAARKIIMVTTMWDKPNVAKEKKESRYEELKTTHWKDLMDRGTRIEKFDNTSRSANTILARVVEEEKCRQLSHLQEESVVLGKQIKNTDAGKVLYDVLQDRLRKQSQELKILQDGGTDPNDPSMVEKRRKKEQEIEQTLKEMGEVKIGFVPKLLSFFKFRKSVAVHVRIFFCL